MPKHAAKKAAQVKRPVKSHCHVHTFLILTAILLMALLVVALLLKFSYLQVPAAPGGFCGTSARDACASNADCVAGGCSGQVCESKNVEPYAGTCEWRGCYDEAKYGLSCGCVAQKCAWK
jgi:eight-cysteine-cluster-containing protein